ncbi:hypothetical protein BN1058_02538 [Paraliobacillus sp. PM-2]|nr:hypothetical protein BN1058_02538 [Paraliobacillus sp. PM-2]
MGYDTDVDIENMSVVDIGENKGLTAVVVTFKDEPKLDYFYTYEDGTKKIIHIDVVNKESIQTKY